MRKRSQYGPQKGFFLLFILLVLLLLLWLIGKRDGWISGLSFNDKWVKRRNWLKPTRKRREHNTFLCLFFVFFLFLFFCNRQKAMCAMDIQTNRLTNEWPKEKECAKKNRERRWWRLRERDTIQLILRNGWAAAATAAQRQRRQK